MLRNLWLWIAVFVVSLMGLACTAAQPASQTPGTDGKPKSGGTFNVPVGDDPTDFDMSYQGSSGTNGQFVRYGYSSVLRLKTGPDIGYGDQVVVPNLAERWEVSPDATTFTFHLRKGLKFANVPPVNGRALTTADVKWSYEYMARLGNFKQLGLGQFTWVFEGMESIQTPDPNTVVVRFKESYAPFLTYAATSDNVIMAREIYEKDGHFKETLAGSGPFQVDSAASQRGSRWVFNKNLTYFEEGKPYLDEVRLLVIKDEATRQAAFKAKQLDSFQGGGDILTWQEIRKTVPEAVEYEYLSTPQNLYVHTKRPPFNDFRVREAISLAYDRDEVIKVVAGGKGEWALSMSNTRPDLFTQDEIKSFIKYDPERAKRLLAEAGYPNGFTVEFMYSDGGTEAYKKAAQLIQAQLKRVGINLVFDVVSSADYTIRRRARNFNIKLTGESSRTDLNAFWQLYTVPTGSFNYIDANDARVSALVAAHRKELDPDKRRQLQRELVRYVNETFLWITTYRTSSIIFMQPYVKDWYHNADYRSVGWTPVVWLDK